ncbi:glycosyltransferase [Clostridium manihotivorum]|uniref:Glycosyl transferase n=1 Tax=Clostridium manihotivorum TaxID=2320868 RepID=A0A410DNF0_9CLOT|nr:glycosyltransferase [Clostridium manihotivorum]QAA30594.1 glycosyl transferase [Clostridium manihotivorum]
MKNQVSLCMIVKNEEEYLPRCLASIKDIVDEIIIVDTGSTDRTLEIAKSFNAKTYFFKWNNNFSEARNESLKHASKDWILIMDADEELYKEDQELVRILLNSKLDENAIYNFQGVSYCGNYIDENNKIINLNPRLFKNNIGLHYEGAIHNQLAYSENNYHVICEDVKVHHYGYLNKRIASTDKRNRNLTILTNQLKKHPNDKFVLFNLGNEYAALGDLEKALEFYYKCYDNFNPDVGFGYALLIRMVYVNFDIGKYDESLRLIGEGINYYPECTDLYFLKAENYKILGKPTLQIKALEKCIELGEPPANLKFFDGTGGVKAFNELGNIYYELRDFETAYNYYIEALKADTSFIDPIYNIVHILKLENKSISEIKTIVESFFDVSCESYILMADLFFKEGDYNTALEYLNKCNDDSLEERVNVLKARCFIRIGGFEDCIALTEINKKEPAYIEFFFSKFISYILLERYNDAYKLLKEIKKEEKTRESYKRRIDIYEQLIKLFIKEPTTILSRDENEHEYLDIVMEICEIMLINKRYDELSIAVNLGNLVSNRSMLLSLGKLYYRNGYLELAKKEILRSIKEFDIYDSGGLDILKILS